MTSGLSSASSMTRRTPIWAQPRAAAAAERQAEPETPAAGSRRETVGRLGTDAERPARQPFEQHPRVLRPR